MAVLSHFCLQKDAASCSDFSLFWREKAEDVNVSQIRQSLACFFCLKDFLLCPVSLVSPGPTWSLRASRSCSLILGQGRRDQWV